MISEPGGPEKLELKVVAKPTAKSGWVLIRNRAFGLNRSEWFTRRCDSPSVMSPRVLGIECAGEVVDAPDDVSDYIESFYNRKRRHQHLGGISPQDFEATVPLEAAVENLESAYSTACEPEAVIPFVHLSFYISRPV